VFAAFIVPGFLFLTAYSKTRARGSVEADLYRIAEAIVWSLLILAVAWWWKGREVLGWAAAGTLTEHEDQAYKFLLALLLVPYPLGLVSGWVVTWGLGKFERLRPAEGSTSRRAEFFYLLEKGGVLQLPTVWDQAWNQVGRLGGLLVRVRSTSGNDLVGTIEPGAWIGISPEPRDVYLRRVYREDGQGSWEPVPNTEGVVVNASAIESVEFLWAAGSGGNPAGQAHGNGRSAPQGSG
jgi:hypothetical protein